MAKHKEMGSNVFQFLGGFLRLVFIILAVCSCSTEKQVIAYEQTQNKQNVSVVYQVYDNGQSIVSVSTTEPIALRTLIMQGFSLNISGAKNYTIEIPSAKDVEGNISHHPGEVKATMQGNQEKRPDIRPLIEALNKVGAQIYANGKKVGTAKSFKSSIDPTTGTLLYSVTLSKVYSMDLPVNITLISKPQLDNDEFQNGNFVNRNEGQRPQPFGVGQPQRPNNGQKEMTIKYQFSVRK